MNLTKRQLICFSCAAVVGIPVYLVTRGIIGDSVAALLMIALMLPFFFVAMYERDGQTAEKIARNIIRTRFLCQGIRPYRTENQYKYLQKKEGGTSSVQKPAKAKAGKTPIHRKIPNKKR